MVKRQASRAERMRERLTQEAARIMVEQGVKDFQLAKRKAAERLGAPDTRNLPQNREIQAAVEDYQRLFGGTAQRERLRALREAALEAMRFFSRFEPRLVGGVLDGTAGAFSDVHLHVFADTPEELVLFLVESDIPFDIDERRFRFGETYALQPVYRFAAGDVRFELTLFDRRGLRQAPNSQVDGQAMRRAGVAELERVLANPPEPGAL